LKKSIISIIGFSLFVIGFLGLILSLVGLRLNILSFFDRISPLLGFITKIVLIMAGLIMVYFDRTREQED
jgi:sulfite exporter TauE/SafE